MFRILRGESITLLARNLEENERNLFFSNALLDLRDEGIVYSDGKLHIISFPTMVIISSSGSWKGSEHVADFIRSLRPVTILAPDRIISPLLSEFGEYKQQERNLMTITASGFCKIPRDNRLRVLRTKEDFIALFRLYGNVPAMAERFSEADDEDNLEDFLSRDFPFTAVALFIGDKAVSGGYISNHRKRNAMLSGIATRQEYRNRGYATSVVSELLDISFSENLMKRLFLWYTDEKAARIYKAIGFRDLGSWICLRKGEENEIHKT